MEYLGKDIPKLGFGLMRLPMLGEEVDLEQTKQMVDKFLEAGFTYFDTAYGYLGGKSEEAVKNRFGGPVPPGELPAGHQAARLGRGPNRRRGQGDAANLAAAHRCRVFRLLPAAQLRRRPHPGL